MNLIPHKDVLTFICEKIGYKLERFGLSAENLFIACKHKLCKAEIFGCFLEKKIKTIIKHDCVSVMCDALFINIIKMS